MRLLTVPVVVVLCCVCAGASIADEKTEKIRQLVEAQGLLAGWTAQMEAGRQASEEQSQQILDQILSELLPNKEFKERFIAAAEDFSNAVTTPWTAEYLVEVFASYYGPQFSEAELDRLIAFYTSELGQKDVQSSHMAVAKWSDHFMKLGQPIVQDALREYLDRIGVRFLNCTC